MSITLGEYNWTSKKTVGDTSGAFYNDITSTPPCEDTVDLSTIQPKWKKIAYFDLGTQFSFFDPSTGNETIRRDLMTSTNIDLVPYLGKILQNGYDYKVKLNWTFNGLTPASGQMRFCYDYNAPSGINLYDLGGFNSGAEVHLSEDGCSGDYQSGVQLLDFTYTDGTGIPFNITIELELYQLCSARWIIENCQGQNINYISNFQFQSVEEEVLYTNNPEVEPVRTTRNISKRKTTYDPYAMGVEEIAKLPKNCRDYTVYYESNIRQGDYFGTPWIPYRYWIDDITKKINIDTTFTPAQIREYRLYEGGLLKFNGNSNASNLLDWTDWIPSLLDKNLEFQVWESGAPVSLVGDITIKLQYDFTEFTCPCACVALCDGELDIEFNLNCGTSETIRVRSSVQDGVYSVEGEAYNALYPIKPIVRTKATYDLVITDYTDEVYLILMDLISDTDTINIYDNIGIPGYTNYVIDIDSLQPAWRFDSKVANIKIPIIRTDSIKTKRRNCCD